MMRSPHKPPVSIHTGQLSSPTCPTPLPLSPFVTTPTAFKMPSATSFFSDFIYIKHCSFWILFLSANMYTLLTIKRMSILLFFFHNCPSRASHTNQGDGCWGSKNKRKNKDYHPITERFGGLCLSVSLRKLYIKPSKKWMQGHLATCLGGTLIPHLPCFHGGRCHLE